MKAKNCFLVSCLMSFVFSNLSVSKSSFFGSESFEFCFLSAFEELIREELSLLLLKFLLSKPLDDFL